MSVGSLLTQNFRNLQYQTINFHSDLNFITGDNGSGKSSVLEAIFFLGHGKSFRTTKPENLVHFNHHHFVISVTKENDTRLGVSRNFSNGQTEIKLNGNKLTRLSDLAINLAVQVITPESFKLFFGGPKERRKFFDLGMFHVKQSFSNNWKELTQILKQRNACLRNKEKTEVLSYWTQQFCSISELVAKQRKEYLDHLQTELNNWLNLLLPDLNNNITVQYLQGWNQKKLLHDILDQNILRDKELGFTSSGAHKFDIRFNIGRNPIENCLSRGQQKLFLLALTLAQAKLIENVKRVKPILLIDDVGAELDINSRNALATAINTLDCQIIITAIEKNVLEPLVPKDNNYKMFHVKQGEILELS